MLNSEAPPSPPRTHATRCLCSLGSGEVVHIVAWKSKPGEEERFDHSCQDISHGLYALTSGLTDVRVCHPQCGEVVFILTFLSKADLQRFKSGPEEDLMRCLRELSKGGIPSFNRSGTLMPDTHTLASLVAFLKTSVRGRSFEDHNISEVGQALARWYPRRTEYGRYINWDTKNPRKYTRNVVFSNEHMDVLLMCWPPNCASSIHDHDGSSCWVALVEGQVHEVQYAYPKLDRRFTEAAAAAASGRCSGVDKVTGRCSKLRVTAVSRLGVGPSSGMGSGSFNTYINDERGLHRVENRSCLPAYTLHVYAPGLRKMALFDAESGRVVMHYPTPVEPTEFEAAGPVQWTSGGVDELPRVATCAALDVVRWNEEQLGKSTTSGGSEE